MKPLPPRDSRGRFTKKSVAALIPIEVLRELGQGRRAVDITLDHQWEVEIISRSHYTVPNSDDDPNAA
jgi:hypothetical protein